MNHFFKSLVLILMAIFLSPAFAAGTTSRLPDVTVNAPIGKLTVVQLTASSPVLKIVTSNSSQWLVRRVKIPLSVTAVAPQAVNGYLVIRPEAKNDKPNNVIVFYRNGEYQSFNFTAG